jgi:anaerobic selenocysteine-containing dehydrogenase
MAWPDQRKTVAAMERLELLACIDVVRTATCELADYVVAGRHQLETPETTGLMEETGTASPSGRHFPRTYGMHTPAVVEPPPGADVIEETQFFVRVARRMGVALTLRGQPIPMDGTLTTDAMLEIVHANSKVPLESVRAHEHGYAGEVERGVVLPAADDDGVRLDVGNEMLLGELATMVDSPDEDDRHPFHLVVRRMAEVCNSMGRTLPQLTAKRDHNPAFVHPDDMERMGVLDGDLIELRSDRGAVVAADSTLRRGIVSCAHSWGGIDDEEQPPSGGTNTNRLIANDTIFDPRSGIPVMSNVPITVRPATPAAGRGAWSRSANDSRQRRRRWEDERT